MRRVSLRIFEHLHRRELGFHLDRKTGGLARDIERGTNGISFLLRFTLFNIVPTILEILLVAGILLVVFNVGYVLAILVAVVVYVCSPSRSPSGERSSCGKPTPGTTSPTPGPSTACSTTKPSNTSTTNATKPNCTTRTWTTGKRPV